MMNRRRDFYGFIFIMSLILLSSPVFAEEDLITTIDELWANREEMQSVKDSIALIEEALTEKERSELYWRQARNYYWLGEKREVEIKEQLEYYEKGEEYAEKAVELNPQCPDCHYWHAVLIGKVGETRGILQSLFMVRPMYNALSKVLELDNEYASAHYVLGILYRKVPRWPLSIGNLDSSLEHALKAVEYDPDNLEFQLGLAEAYLARREHDKAREILEMILEAPVMPDAVVESENVKRTAEKLLEEHF